MKKFLLAAVVTLVALATVLTGCGTNFNYSVDTKDFSSQAVLTNGGYVAKQGNYLYFVNGVGSPSLENHFGKAVKGAIMRYELNDQGEFVENSLQTVVPKIVYSTDKTSSGFAICGDYIYYVTPSQKIDKKGNLMTNIIEFYRAKTDGSSTQLLATVTGAGAKYAFSENGVIYFVNNELYVIDCTKDKIESTLVAEKVTSALVNTGCGYAFYTVADENDNETANYTYAVNAKGEKTELITPTTYTQNDKENRLRFTIALASFQGNTLYYNKTYYESGSAVTCGADAGLYAYDMQNGVAAIVPANEVKIGFEPSTTFVRLDAKNVLATVSSEIDLVNTTKTAAGDPVYNSVKSFGSAITIVEVKDVVSTESALSCTILFKRSNDQNIWQYNLAYTITDGVYEFDDGALVQAEKLTEVTASSNYLANAILDGYYYFEDSYGYISRVKVGDLETEAQRLGKMNETDQAKFDKDNAPSEE